MPLPDEELLITRTFEAPAALVFRLWAEREHMKAWWGPKDFTCTHLDLDFRPGGKWRACIVSEAYGEIWSGGVFQEIEPEKRIVFTFAWENAWERADPNTLVTVTFTETDGQTVQRFHQVPFETREERDSHLEGWNECLDRQEDYLTRLGAPAR